MRPWVMQ